MKLDLKWIKNVQVNLSAVERRTSTLIKRRSVKKEYQAAWLLKAITLIDLTTLSGDDTYGKVDRLCEKAILPLSFELQKLLEIPERSISVAALCVYHHLVKEAKKKLKDRIPIAAVSTGFPAGLSSFKTRKQEIIVNHIFLLGCSFKNTELSIAVANGVSATIIKVLATFVF